MSPLLRRTPALSPAPAATPGPTAKTSSPAGLWTAEALLRLVQGHCLHEQNWSATGLAWTTESLRPGFLFVALPDAPDGDGHERVGEATAQGAVAAIVERTPPRTPSGFPLIYVESSCAALQALQAAPSFLNAQDSHDRLPSPGK